jgi:hypothetical protein
LHKLLKLSRNFVSIFRIDFLHVDKPFMNQTVKMFVLQISYLRLFALNDYAV